MERKKIYIDDRYFSSGENILWPLLAHLSYFASNQMCLCVIFIQKNQKWFYYNVEWTAHQSQWGKIYVYRSISLIFTTNWPGIRNIYTNTCTQRKMNQKKMMMMKKKKPKGKWFWVIWCRNELFALALLTSNWYALESFHLTFELNCDSFRNHFIIHTYIPVYLPLISVASVCWLLFFASALGIDLSCLVRHLYLSIHMLPQTYDELISFRFSGHCYFDFTRPLTQWLWRMCCVYVDVDMLFT